MGVHCAAFCLLFFDTIISIGFIAFPGVLGFDNLVKLYDLILSISSSLAISSSKAVARFKSNKAPPKSPR
jgi:hypothetical protein